MEVENNTSTVFDIEKDLEKAETPESPAYSIQDETGETPTAISGPQEPSHDNGFEDEIEKEEQGNQMNLTKTRSTISIAEQMSLTREILFVFVICMAQFMTRTSLHCLPIPTSVEHPPLTQSTTIQPH